MIEKNQITIKNFDKVLIQNGDIHSNQLKLNQSGEIFFLDLEYCLFVSIENILTTRNLIQSNKIFF